MLARTYGAALIAATAITLTGACGSSHPSAARPAATAAASRLEIDDVSPVGAPTPRAILAVRPPNRFQIPSIGVDAGVEHVPFLAVPQDPNKVAWFKTGPAPGEPGDAVFDGHLDWISGPAVFWHLRDVKIGDQLIVSSEGTPALTFIVTEVDVVAASSTPPTWLYAVAGPPEMSLITCEGVYNRSAGYNERLLVRSALKEPPL